MCDQKLSILNETDTFIGYNIWRLTFRFLFCENKTGLSDRSLQKLIVRTLSLLASFAICC